jgi:lysophospholipase L1-like esterase
LRNGRLLPEPDYVFNNMCNNDHAIVTSAYIAWVEAMRVACPNARIFCIVPASAYHRSEIEAVVTALNQSGDARVYLIDVPLMNTLAPNAGKATQGSYDGGHPNLYGQAVFGAAVVVKVQEILSKERQP